MVTAVKLLQVISHPPPPVFRLEGRYNKTVPPVIFHGSYLLGCSQPANMYIYLHRAVCIVGLCFGGGEQCFNKPLCSSCTPTVVGLFHYEMMFERSEKVGRAE